MLCLYDTMCSLKVLDIIAKSLEIVLKGKGLDLMYPLNAHHSMVTSITYLVLF